MELTIKQKHLTTIYKKDVVINKNKIVELSEKVKLLNPTFRITHETYYINEIDVFSFFSEFRKGKVCSDFARFSSTIIKPIGIILVGEPDNIYRIVVIMSDYNVVSVELKFDDVICNFLYLSKKELLSLMKRECKPNHLIFKGTKQTNMYWTDYKLDNDLDGKFTFGSGKNKTDLLELGTTFGNIYRTFLDCLKRNIFKNPMAEVLLSCFNNGKIDY
jgi:hypothetical protein